jgi:hypothetical protein
MARLDAADEFTPAQRRTLRETSARRLPRAVAPATTGIDRAAAADDAETIAPIRAPFVDDEGDPTA